MIVQESYASVSATGTYDHSWSGYGGNRVWGALIVTLKIAAVDATTLGWRGSRPDTVSHQAGQPRRGGGMSPPCHKVPDTLTGYRRTREGLWVPDWMPDRRAA